MHNGFQVLSSGPVLPDEIRRVSLPRAPPVFVQKKRFPFVCGEREWMVAVPVSWCVTRILIPRFPGITSTWDWDGAERDSAFPYAGEMMEDDDDPFLVTIPFHPGCRQRRQSAHFHWRRNWWASAHPAFSFHRESNGWRWTWRGQHSVLHMSVLWCVDWTGLLLLLHRDKTAFCLCGGSVPDPKPLGA